MKLLAQQGSMEGEKIFSGLGSGAIDGVILSPRNLSLETLRDRIAKYRSQRNDTQLLFDPQFYAAFSPSGDGHKLGYLIEDYSEYFRPVRKNQLMKESAVEDLLGRCIKFQSGLKGLSGVIAPNILISRSLDSVETVISMNFMRLARKVAAQQNYHGKLFVTLAISREALFKEQEVIEFVNELTALEERPDGFYILIEARNQEARSEIFNADVLAVWMYLNHALSINGFEVINGYSDLVAPLLCAAGGSAGATGWWSNLRSFSIERFEPSAGGGRLPIQRYLSCSLLNRITFYELNQLRNIPGILNGLPTDAEYPTDAEPARNREVLQSWEAIRCLIDKVTSAGSEVVERVSKTVEMVEGAQSLYDKIGPMYTLDQKSNSDHLAALLEGIGAFRKLSEIDA